MYDRLKRVMATKSFAQKVVNTTHGSGWFVQIFSTQELPTKYDASRGEKWGAAIYFLHLCFPIFRTRLRNCAPKWNVHPGKHTNEHT